MNHTAKLQNCFACILLAAVVWTAGCIPFIHHSDPLAGWKIDFNHQPDQAIEKDYKDYIEKLPPKEKRSVRLGQYFKDGTGQHAIEIVVGLNGVYWRHILIYDKANERIKKIKYSNGFYMD